MKISPFSTSKLGTSLAESIEESASEPARSLDGKVVEIVANIGGVEDARQAVEFGAEGVGFLRTEFLYLDFGRLPTEEDRLPFTGRSSR